MKVGGEYATTKMDTVFSADQRPLLSFTFAVNDIVPDVVSRPVVKLLDVPEYPPPVMLYALIVDPLLPAAPLIVSVTLDLFCT